MRSFRSQPEVEDGLSLKEEGTDEKEDDKVSIFDFTTDVTNNLGGTLYLKSEITDYALCLRPKSKDLSYAEEGSGTYYLIRAYDDMYHVHSIHDAATNTFYGKINKKTVLGVRPIICLDIEKYYSVFMHINDTLGGSVTGEGTYANNSLVTLTATANIDYEFIGWINNSTGEYLANTPTYEFNINKNYSITAKFLKKYYITYENVEGADNHNNPEYYTTEDVKEDLFIATKEGYKFRWWEKDGKYVEYIDTSWKENITLTAIWEAIVSPSLS